MWRHIQSSVTGPSHAKSGAPCQDSQLVRRLGGEAGDAIALCVADGAGSSRHSDEGSSIACDTVVARAAEHFDQHGSFAGVTEADAVGWCRAARQRLRDLAEDREEDTREFATTLCVALLSPGGSAFFQIGDGAIVVRRSEPYGVVFWPQSGEYANSTVFLTGDQYEDHLRFASFDGDFRDVALMTDGLERVALSFEGMNPHAPFFQPLFGALHKASDPASLNPELRRFLESDSMRVRSDDDKTVVLATQSAG